MSETHAYQGWEIFSATWKMRGKMILEIILILSIIQLPVFYLLSWFLVGSFGLELVTKHLSAKVLHMFFMNPSFNLSGGTIAGIEFPAMAASAKTILNSQKVSAVLSGVYFKMFFAGFLSFGVYGFFPMVVRKMGARGVKEVATEHIRGMQLISVEEMQELIKTEPAILPLGPILLPAKYEPEQLLLAGKTRVGKTVAMIQMVEAIRRKKGKAILHDFRGELTARFYNPETDFILNPLDARSAGWDVFNDLQSITDISSVCDSLIPPVGNDPFWPKAASAVLKGVMAYCYVNNKRSNRDLWKALTSSTLEIVEMCNSTVAGQAGYRVIEDPKSKQTAGILAVMMANVSWLEYSSDKPGGFSIDAWLGQAGEGFIFLTGKAAVRETIKPLTGLFVELLGKKILDLSEDSSRRIYFILDEFGNMQMLPTLPELLTGAGAKGAIFVLAIQDVARIQKVYGRELTETILNSCGTTLTLKLKDAATAKVFSDSMGEHEFWEAKKSYRMSSSESTDAETITRERVTALLVMPSQIMSLPKLEGFLTIPECNPTKIKLEIKPENQRGLIQPDFVLQPGFSLEDLKNKHDKLWSDIEDLTNGALSLIAEEEQEVDGEQELPSKKTPQTTNKLSLDVGNDLI